MAPEAPSEKKCSTAWKYCVIEQHTTTTVCAVTCCASYCIFVGPSTVRNSSTSAAVSQRKMSEKLVHAITHIYTDGDQDDSRCKRSPSITVVVNLVEHRARFGPLHNIHSHSQHDAQLSATTTTTADRRTLAQIFFKPNGTTPRTVQ